MAAELLGTFEHIVLLAVLQLAEEAYGRSVLREVQTGVGDNRNVAAGAVYATLDRLETKGLLASRLDEGTPARGGRVRRFYVLTARGISALNDTRTALETMWKGTPWPLATLG